MPNEKGWGVLFTDAALNELGDEIKPHLTEGALGLYMFCKHVDMSQQYLRMVVDCSLSDDSPFELEFYVPHHYVKLIVSGTEEKLNRVIGFVGKNR